MDMLSIIIVLLFSLSVAHVAISTLCLSRRKSNQKLPPGPTPLPLLGNLLQIGKNPHKSMADLAARYGPLMTVMLGQIPTIVVSNADMAREVTKTHDQSLSGRKVRDAVTAVDHHEYSLAWLPVSTRWRHLRRICNVHLFAPKHLDATQSLRRQKVDELVEFMSDSGRVGKAVDIGQAAFVTSLNLMSNTIFSVDMASLGSEKAHKFRDLMNSAMDEVGNANISDYFPVLKKFDPQGIKRRSATQTLKIFDVFDGIISERLELRKGGSKRNDTLDTLLNIYDDNEIDAIQIKHLLLDLFQAATDTTSITLEWVMAEIVRNPDVMLKARREIEQNIESERSIQESDICRLPYLQAVVKESLRIHPTVPLLVPRMAVDDAVINGYTVPSQAQVLVNVYAIGRDPNTWTNPNEFLPERFLGLNVDVLGRNHELIPFGAGLRICPGLQLALRMVYLVVASLVRSFDWELEGELTRETMDMEGEFHIMFRKTRELRAIPIPL